jgi:Secretion system C-terminal sorting domain
MQFKYIFLISTLFFVILSKSESQSCLPGITQLTSQAQVDAFPSNYPGCTTILGSLYITGSNITNLSPLSQITSINGTLLILNNTNLTNLIGLHNIQIIGGAVGIVGNSMLLSLSPFNPTSIGNNIQISQNAILNSIELNNVSNNITGLFINDNPLLFSFQMLQLSSISGSSFSQFGIARNPLLNQVELNNLTDLNTSQFVIENCGLLSLDFLSGVNGTIEIFEIKDNSSLSNFGNISLNITSFLNIENNDLLTNLQGLSNITQLVGELNISNNDLLVSLSGLESITSIGNLTLNNNQLLTSLAGLNNILNMNGPTLNIENNPQLEHFLSLNSNLNSNFSEIIIKNNALLSNISNLNNINASGYYGGIEIEMNPLLNSLEGIYSSTAPFIENLGNFRIVNNGTLTSLSGLDSIYHYGSVEIQNNINLNECEIWGICSLIEDCGTSCFSISNNAVNCNSFTDVKTACDALLPIELTSFFATSKENRVNLHWQTTSEINNHYFEIGHSQNGLNFKSIGRKEGGGNSNALLDYHFVHKDVSPGLHYYRLKQVDYDGKYSYSDIKSVEVKGEGNDVFIYPNPSTNIINVNGADGLNYTLYDVVGRQVNDGQISNNAISIDHLSTGMYYLHLDSDSVKSVYKIWKE